MTPNDVKIVADNIDDFIEVPDGLARLRKAVLTLAVSGKLAPQDKKEGTAQELFAQVLVESSKYTTGRKKKSSNLAPLSQDEIPFEIPASWKWVRIREITRDCGQKTPDKDFCYVDVSSIDSSRGVIVEPKYLKPSEAPSRARKLVEDKSIIYSGVRPYLLNTAIVDLSSLEEEVIVSTAFFVLKPYANISSEYIHLMVRSPYFDELSNRACVGAAYPAINDDKFEKLPVPLPPLQEQKRIVKRVKEVMKQLDELEVKKQERDEMRTRLVRSAMQSLGKSESKIAFEQLTELVKTPSDIKELENALLTLAVSGKLVPQSKADGTAENLYNQIQKERTKAENNSTARKKKTKDLAPIADDEIPFEVPASWKWVRLGDCMSISSGDSLSVKDAKEGKYLVYGGNGIAGRHSAFNTKKGTIVIGRVGALCGIAHIVESDAWVTDNAFIVDYPVELIDREYFALVLNYLNLRSTHRGSAQPVISGISVYPTPMPLAPLAEQKRIVKKVEEVMTLINRLKESLL